AQLHTLEVGDGPEVVVMLHGGPGASHDYLRPGLDAVAVPGRRRLFYYDQRGSGRSPLDAGVAPGTWQDHVADLDAVREHLGGAPLTLVGYSWGELRARLDMTDRRNRFAIAVAGYFVEPERALGLTPFVVKQSAEEAVWKSLGTHYDLRPQLATLGIPAFVAHGEEDPIPVVTARATAQALGGELVAIPRCGHVPYVEAPDALFGPLLRFLG